MSEEIKPCPFCGGTPHTFEGMAGVCVYCWEEDGSCGHRVIIMTLEEWNTRTEKKYKWASFHEWWVEVPYMMQKLLQGADIAKSTFNAARERA